MSVQVQHRRDTTGNIEANTPAAGELWWDTSKNEASLGNGVLSGGVRIAKKNVGDIVIAAQIAANTNDYSPTNLKHASSLLVSTDASRDITGLVPIGVADTVDGLEKTIYNAGSFNVVLRDQSTSSNAANRFDLGGADVTLGPKQSVTLRYRTQGGLNRWEIKARTDGQAPADGSIAARKLTSSGVPLRAGLVNGTILESRAGNAVTFAVKTLAGNDPSATDPVFAVFQNGSGGYVVRTIAAALSLTISNGSSMGVPGNGIPFALWHVLIDTGAGVVLGAVNCVSGVNIMPLIEASVYSSTAEGGAGAADNAQTIYTAVAQTSKYLCLVGYSDYDAGLATAGAWSVPPSRTVLWSPGMPKPGDFLRETIATYAANADLTVFIPNDDTIPQSNEGTQIISASHVVSRAANRVDAQFSAIGTCGAGAQPLISALFFNAGANAIAATCVNSAGADAPQEMFCECAHMPGLVGAQTYAVRVGGQAATIRLNGVSTTRRFGGVQLATLRLKEYQG